MEENRKDRRKTGLLLSILGVVSLVLITAGVTYAFFNYAKEGQTENVITTGTINFAYNETEANGSGILIQDALPITDAVGKALDGTEGSGKSFHFTVTSVTPSTARIPYVVTIKKSNTSTLSDDQVKFYLVATGSETGNGETLNNDVVKTFSQLPGADANNSLTADLGADEKVVFNGLVPASASNYATDFTLRMWLSGDVSSNSVADYSPYEFMLKTVAGAANQTVSVTGGDIEVPTATNTAAINAEDAIRNGSFITSTAYYALNATGSCSDTSATTKAACQAITGATWTAGKDEYERVAYVNTNDKTVLTRSQAVALNKATVDIYGNYEFTDIDGFAKDEQYYQVNGQSYTVKVNVYAAGAKVTSGN